MASQTLGFAELLAGGVLIMSSITGKSLRDTVAGGTSAPAATAGVTGSVGASGAPGGGRLAPDPGKVGAGVHGATGPLTTTTTPGGESVTAAASAEGLHYDPVSNQYVPNVQTSAFISPRDIALVGALTGA